MKELMVFICFVLGTPGTAGELVLNVLVTNIEQLKIPIYFS